MLRSRSLIVGLCVSVLAACGGGGSGDGGDDDGVDAAPGDIDSAVPDGWTSLLEGDWTLPAGQPDTYYCVYATVPRDMYVKAFRPLIPVGTHHTVLTLFDNASPADGIYPCNVGTNGQSMIYGSGVGSPDFTFPAGVGLHLRAGQRLLLNLHLYNASDATITGDSAILVKSQPTATPTLAEMVFAGNLNFSIPAGAMNHEIVGGCTSNVDYSLFAVWPHMHQFATEQKVEHIRGGTTTVLHDGAYSFEEQNYYVQSPIFQVQQGDQIRVTCTYNNPLNTSIPFGDSSNQEMCFSGLYRYPAQGGNIFSCSSFF